eukprot:scaffold42714_cov23-Cyclotella_meneghiniana.AAC.1
MLSPPLHPPPALTQPPPALAMLSPPPLRPPLALTQPPPPNTCDKSIVVHSVVSNSARLLLLVVAQDVYCVPRTTLRQWSHRSHELKGLYCGL